LTSFTTIFGKDNIPKMSIYRYISILVLSMLACGGLAELPGASLPPASPLPTPPVPVMVVTGDLNIRVAPGEKNPLVEGKNVLHAGDVVTCFEFYVIGEGLWCRHERGWSNVRWMQAKGNQK